MKAKLFTSFLVLTLFLGTLVPSVKAHPGDQHGEGDGHLFGTGAYGNIEFVSNEIVTSTEGLVADVAISPDGQWAFLANWGEAKCSLNSEAGGQNNPDAGAWVVDISNLSDPVTVGFIPSHQDSRPGEGMQVINLTTKQFNGNLLVMNNEQCGKNGKGGVSLWDVTDPRKPFKVSEHFGDFNSSDTNDIHSAFAWDAGSNAYLVMTDNLEATDVDILDITNPSRPRLIKELNLSASFPSIRQDASIPNLIEVFLHDMVVKNIDGNWVMLLSYWDGGYVQLNVNDPANPTLIGDTDYTNPDPELLESTGISLPPEGNGHQNEFTSDNQFFIGTDEDFAPYNVVAMNTTDGVAIQATQGTDTPQIDNDTSLVGQTVFVGRACNGDPVVPSAGAATVALVERGLCTFTEKVANVEAAGGYSGVIVFNREGADGCSGLVLMDVQGNIPALFVNRPTGFALMNNGSYNEAACLSGSSQAPFAIGTLGDSVDISALFDGWGYVHLFSNTLSGGKFAELDTFAIPEAHDPAFAFGYGDLSVHEVATDPQFANFAYLSYYAGGLRSLEISCQGNSGNCDLVEVGGYLDQNGNNFWGVEAFVRNGCTYIAGSDRDSGLWIFKNSDTCP
ncbi:MAG: hypothetical protein HYZ22_02400 [Chloroflexi bacterium]|nr:hypothetical protein [Chloroflexota bacterium]